MTHSVYAGFANFSAALQLLFILDFRLINTMGMRRLRARIVMLMWILILGWSFIGLGWSLGGLRVLDGVRGLGC